MINQQEEGEKGLMELGPCEEFTEPAISPPMDCDAILLFNNSDLSSTRRTERGPNWTRS